MRPLYERTGSLLEGVTMMPERAVRRATCILAVPMRHSTLARLSQSERRITGSDDFLCRHLTTTQARTSSMRVPSLNEWLAHRYRAIGVRYCHDVRGDTMGAIGGSPYYAIAPPCKP